MPLKNAKAKGSRLERKSRDILRDAGFLVVKACFKFLVERDEWLPLLEKCIPILESGFDPLARAQHEAMAIPGVRAVERQSKR